MIRIFVRSLFMSAVFFASVCPLRAEVSTLRIARQYGINYLPLMVMEHDRLVEKHAKTLGLDKLAVEWTQVSSGSATNELLISGNVNIASGGVGPFVVLWARTHNNLDVKGIASLDSMPVVLNSRDPKVHTIKDLSDHNRIALPAIKVSIQAVTLEMAAAKAFGRDHYDKLDHLTVSMSHPDGMAALLSGGTEITGHFTGPPYSELELQHPGIHQVISSYQVLGGETTSTLVWAASKFRAENPKTYAAFYAAVKEAINWIHANKRAAAALYIQMTHSKQTVDQLYKILSDPDIVYTIVPKNVTKYADFMRRVSKISIKPASWKDMFFPELHNENGS